MDNNNKIRYLEKETPSDNESGEKMDLLQMCAGLMMIELDLEIDKNVPEGPDDALFVVPREIKSEYGSAIMVLDFVYDLAGKSYDTEGHDDNPFLDGDMMKAMMRELPEQELSVMVRGLTDPVLRSLAVEALAEKAKRARATWQKRMNHEASTKYRPKERWKQ